MSQTLQAVKFYDGMFKLSNKMVDMCLLVKDAHDKNLCWLVMLLTPQMTETFCT